MSVCREFSGRTQLIAFPSTKHFFPLSCGITASFYVVNFSFSVVFASSSFYLPCLHIRGSQGSVPALLSPPTPQVIPSLVTLNTTYTLMTLTFISSSKFQRIISSAPLGSSTWIYHHRRLKLNTRTPFPILIFPIFSTKPFLLQPSPSLYKGRADPSLQVLGSVVLEASPAAPLVHWRVLSAIPPRSSAGLCVPLHCCPAGLGTKSSHPEFASLLSRLASCGLFLTQQSERSFEEHRRSHEPPRPCLTHNKA